MQLFCVVFLHPLHCNSFRAKKKLKKSVKKFALYCFLLYLYTIRKIKKVITIKNKKNMKAFRYNCEKRGDRKYNNCGKEKNPNAVKFYAKNMEYASKYKYIYNEDGDVIAECKLEVVEIENVNLFDMANNFKTLATYNNYIADEIDTRMRDYTYYMNKEKKASERKKWANRIEQLKNSEDELITNLFRSEFQELSDFERQNELVAELKALGFDGYTTKNEIAIF